MFMNMLIRYLKNLKQKEYSFGSLIPQSVAKRSEEYLQGCFDLHCMFVVSCEKGGEYVKVKDIIHTIKTTDEYFNMSKAQKRYFKEETVRDLFRRNPVYRTCYKEDFQSNDGHVRNVLLGWKKKQDGEGEPPDDVC